MRLGVVLAGGRGERLGGGVPKAGIVWAGRTLLARAEATLAAISDEVLISAPATLPLDVADERRVADIAGAEGPLAGLVAALSARTYTQAVVLAVDLPFMSSAALESLRADLVPPWSAVVPMPAGIPQPLAAWYAPVAARQLAEVLARGERSVTRAVWTLNVRAIEAERLRHHPGGESAYFNLNTPADLAEAARRERQEPA